MDKEDTTTTNSLTGQLLIAMPGLMDPNFHGTVSLICEHNEDGAIGFVINQPLQLNLATVLEQIGVTTNEDCEKQPVLSGGPVSIERGFVLHRTDQTQWQSSMNVSDQISVTTSDDIIQAMSNGTAPEGSILMLGYAGWAKGQLEQEVMENSWLTLPASTDVVFDADFDQRLELATKNVGIDFNRMSTSAGHA